MYASRSYVVRDTLLEFPETYSPRHAIDPSVALQHMQSCKVAIDFYKCRTENRLERFLVVEADASGDSSDFGDTVMYGLWWSEEHGEWLPAHRTLREMDDHQYILLPWYPVYSKRLNTIGAAIAYINSNGTTMCS